MRVTRRQQKQLEAVIARPSAPAGVVRRARVVLLSAAGTSGVAIAAQLALSAESVSRIRRRFVDGGVDGLLDQPKAGRRDHAVPADTVEQILQLAPSPPPAGRSRWTTRLLAHAVGRTSGCVSDILRAHGLKPHLVRTYKVSRDPAFAAKVTDVVGLYLRPPEHAIVSASTRRRRFRRWAEFFAQGQSPLPKQDDLWKKTNIDTWTGLAASAECNDFTDELLTLNVKDPWAVTWIKDIAEGRAWAANNGFEWPITFVPLRECNNSDPRPQIIFSNLSENSTITTNPLDIYAVVRAPNDFASFRLEWGQGNDPVHLFRRNVFPADMDHHLKRLVVLGRGRIPLSGNIDPEARDLGLTCWPVHRSPRPSTTPLTRTITCGAGCTASPSTAWSWGGRSAFRARLRA